MTRRVSPKASVVAVGRVSTGAVINEFSFLSSEPRTATVRVAPRSEVYICGRQHFEQILASLPPEAAAGVKAAAHAKRLRDVKRRFVLSPALLLGSPAAAAAAATATAAGPQHQQQTQPPARIKHTNTNTNGSNAAATTTLLAGCSRAFLQALCAVFQPLCVDPGHVFASSSASVPAPPQLCLVLRGELGVKRDLTTSGNTTASASSLGSTRPRRRPTVTALHAAAAAAATIVVVGGGGASDLGELVGRRPTPALLNDVAALVHGHGPSATAGQQQQQHQQQDGEIVFALTACDGYAADADDVQRVLAAHPADRATIAGYAQQRQQKNATAQMAQHRQAISQIPIVGSRLGPEALKAFSLLFEARVYPPLTVLCSASETAERLMILTKGSARIDSGRGRDEPSRSWAMNECVGYTCFVAHRWRHSVVSTSTVEIIQIRKELLFAFVQDCGFFRDAVCAAKALLFPNAPLRDERERAAAAAALQEESRLRTPLMHPVYIDSEVKATREGIVPSQTACAPTYVLGGLSASQLPTVSRLSLKERMAIEDEVVREFIATSSAHGGGNGRGADGGSRNAMIKITNYLYIKPSDH